MSHTAAPIGVLDSGIGGFSVVRQVQRLLPGEDLLYFGDGAHIPYGNHDEETIVAMARYMFRVLEQRQVKALLVACNTISCVIEQCADRVCCPVFSAVQAGADAAVRLEVDKVGVISTIFTHNSRVYPRKIQERSPRKVVVLSCGCPDLARLVEYSLGSPEKMPQVEENLRLELDHMVLEEKVDCCVLGCTHYPLAEDRFRRLYPDRVWIDPAEELAACVKHFLAENNLLNPSPGLGHMEICTTGSARDYARKAEKAGLRQITCVRHLAV